MHAEINYFSTAVEMYIAAAELVCESAAKAIASSGSFSLLLAGGETPLPLYRRLRMLPFPWNKTDFFWGDERCVSPLDIRSNYAKVVEAFLKDVPVPQKNIHRIKAELPPNEAAVAYAEELSEFKRLNERDKLFDLVLLGMGEDGHAASLFPGSAALRETEKLVVAVAIPENAQPVVARLTLTYPALADSEMVLFLVKGKTKRDLLASGKDFPASAVKSKKIICFTA